MIHCIIFFFFSTLQLSVPYTVSRCCYSSHALADIPEGGIVDVPLAQTGEGIAECELLKWFVKEMSERR